MDEKLRALIDQIPEKPPRSKLEPHLDVIRELRRKRRTYQEIAQFFAEHLSVTIAASTIHAFVQVRARRRKERPPIELPAREPQIETAPATEATAAAAGPNDVRARIEALKRRPPPEKPKRVFEYDENEPLRLARETKQEE